MGDENYNFLFFQQREQTCSHVRIYYLVGDLLCSESSLENSSGADNDDEVDISYGLTPCSYEPMHSNILSI